MIPEVRAWHIDRPKVLDKLDTALKRRLGLVMAPAGYGKTTILAQWADRVMANGAVAAWLSLDVGDSEPAQFVAYIVWALEAAGVALGETLGMVGHAFGQVPPDSVLTSLLNELGRTRADTVLVLDDYHRAENKDVDQIVNSLIDSALGRSRTIIG